jgi:hypothetical protein
MPEWQRFPEADVGELRKIAVKLELNNKTE